MSVTRDNSSIKVVKEIKKIIPKNIKKNLVEYDSNPFEKKIEDKLNKFNSGKNNKEKEKTNYSGISNLNNDSFIYSIDKDTNKLINSNIKKSIRTSSAINLRKNDDSFTFSNPSNYNDKNKNKNNINSFNDNNNSNNNSPNKYSFRNYVKNDNDKSKKINREIKKEVKPFRVTKVNNDKYKNINMDNNNNKNKEKKPLNIDDMWKRFEESKMKSNIKKDYLKKKIDAENSKKYNFVPNITKSTKYDNENVDFLKRVEIYKFVTEAKKSELKEKNKERFNK